jgi:hypothetical protein
MSISLISLFLLVGVNTLSTDKITSNNYEKRINISFSTIENQIDNYRKVYHKYPTESNWESELYPDFGSKPQIDFGKWYLINQNNDFQICLEITENDFNNELIDKIITEKNTYAKKDTNCSGLTGISITKKV